MPIFSEGLPQRCWRTHVSSSHEVCRAGSEPCQCTNSSRRHLFLLGGRVVLPMERLQYPQARSPSIHKPTVGQAWKTGFIGLRWRWTCHYQQLVCSRQMKSVAQLISSCSRCQISVGELHTTPKCYVSPLTVWEAKNSQLRCLALMSNMARGESRAMLLCLQEI